MEKITEELRLTSRSGGRFEWLLGYFFTDEDAGNHQVLNALDFDGNAIAGLDPHRDHRPALDLQGACCLRERDVPVY